MDARRLSAMRRGAWLLNFARGEHVVDAALIEAVVSGHLGGAVLDAFRQEPLPPQHPFWTTPGITVLPHIGGRHAERDRMVAALFVENLRHFLAGAPLTALADRRRGY
jgi:phosphoglycerate dehydrogenase-like enzyme